MYSTDLEPDNYISKDRIICRPMKLNGIVADYAQNKGGSKMHYVQITVNPIICLSKMGFVHRKPQTICPSGTLFHWCHLQL